MPETKHILNPNKWIDSYSDYLYQYTLSRISDSEMSKDLVQETFLSGLKAMSNFKGEASERTWLIAILKRKIVDYYRKINSKKGRSEVKMNFYESGENKGKWLEERVPQPWETETVDILENEELKRIIDLCIDYIPEKYAIVFRMKTIQEYNTEEICKELGISTSNFWVMIHRARLQLRECLDENWFNT